jgi:hypothetical protein
MTYRLVTKELIITTKEEKLFIKMCKQNKKKKQEVWQYGNMTNKNK